MAIFRCPLCDLPLTEAEARLATCPACGESPARPAPTTDAASAAAPAVNTRSRRRPILLLVGGTAAVLAVVALAIWYGTRERSGAIAAVPPAPLVKAAAPAVAPSAPAAAVLPGAAAGERASVEYPEPALATAKGPGDDIGPGDIGARVKPGGMPAAAPEVAAEKPVPPAPPAPAMPLPPANNDLAQLFKQAGFPDRDVQELLKLAGGPDVDFKELANRAAQQDEELEKLFRMAGMQDLDLARSARTIQGLGQLSAIVRPLAARSAFGPMMVAPPRGIDELDLSGLPITDAKLEQFRKLPGLKSLNLSGTAVTGAGLGHFKKLRQLNLRGTRITDGGLQHLEGLTDLRELNLTDTRVSDAAVERLRNALPLVTVVR
jgi:Leucine Rich repeat